MYIQSESGGFYRLPLTFNQNSRGAVSLATVFNPLCTCNNMAAALLLYLYHQSVRALLILEEADVELGAVGGP